MNCEALRIRTHLINMLLRLNSAKLAWAGTFLQHSHCRCCWCPLCGLLSRGVSIQTCRSMGAQLAPVEQMGFIDRKVTAPWYG